MKTTARRRRLSVVAVAVTTAALGLVLVPSAHGPSAVAAVGTPALVSGPGSQVWSLSDTGRYVYYANPTLTNQRKDRSTGSTTSVSRSGPSVMSGDARVTYTVSSSRVYRQIFGSGSGGIALGSDWSPSGAPTTSRTSAHVGVRAISPNRGQTAPMLWNASTRTAKRLTGSTWRNGETPFVSHSGKHVVYVAYPSTEPTGCTRCGSVYRYTISTGRTAFVSRNRAGNRSLTGLMHAPVVSADGSRVYFLSNATDLVAGATSRTWRLYLRNMTTGTTSLVSSGACAPAYNHECRLSVDAAGNRVLFTRPTSTGDQVYLYDRGRGTTTQVSRGSSTPNRGAYAHAISADGRVIAFSTGATNISSRGAGTYVRTVS